MLISAIRIAIVLAITAQFGYAGQGTWTTGGPYGGDVMALAIDPSAPGTVYAGTDGGGIFRSTDSGGTWTAVNSGLTSPNIRALAINGTTPATVYAGTVFGAGVFKSTNGGATWAVSSSGLTSLNVNALAINPATPATLYAATDGGVFRSIDGGAGWTAFNSGLTNLFVYTVAIDPVTPTTLYAATNGGGVFKSMNGTAWVAVNNGLLDPFVYTMAVNPASPGILYAGTDSGVFKSVDGGSNWATVNSGLTNLIISVVAITPSSPATLYATTTDGVFKSVDSGGNWSAAASGLPNQTVLALAINPTTGSTVYGGLGSGAGIFKSTTSGNSWAVANAGLTSVNVRALAVNPATPAMVYAGTILSDGLFKSVNSGGSWTASNSGLPTSIFVNGLAIDPATPTTLYAATSGGGVFKSTNAGGTWSAANNGLPTLFVYALAINPATPATVYAATDEGVFRSIDSGVNWTVARTGLTSSFVVAIAIDPLTPTTLYAGTDGGVFKSTTSGTTWTSAGLTTRLVNAFAIDPAASANVYAGTDGGVFKSADSGAMWTAANTGLTPLNVLSLAINPATPATLHAGTLGGGVFTSINAAGSWTGNNTGLASPSLRVYALATNPAGTTLYAGLESGSVRQLSFGVATAPQVTTHPASQSVAPGGTASFTAAASGSPSPTVQWQVSINNGSTWSDISGATSTTYSFTAAIADTGKQYRAVFTNNAGSATTNAAILTVSSTTSAPSVTTHPANQIVPQGGTASFSAAASGSPSPTVQWQMSTTGGATFADIPGASATTYSFTVALADSGRQFRAVFTNTAGVATTTAATLTVNSAASAPSVTTHPANQTVTEGATASFSASASGSPSPTAQWQVSTNAGTSFSDVFGATSTTYSFAVTASDNGKRVRAVFTNSAGTATTSAAMLTVGRPSMALDKTSLVFGAVTTGAAFTSQTPAQVVRLTQSGVGTVQWTLTSTAPWLVVSPSSGAGSGAFTISTQFVAGLAATQTASVYVVMSGAANNVGPINVTLNTTPSTAPASPPFGVLETPTGDGTVLAGSIAVTGWTLDNIGVKRVELWRDLQPGETTPPFASTPADPRHGKVFIASPTFVEGARPDVEALNPTAALASRAGWGYLLLTWGLWNQGNGTYQLHAFAFDEEDNLATIGSRTIVVSNNTATRPFGSIDTPEIGGVASGPNFGWALTPTVNGAATCRIQPSGVQVSIDSGPLQPVVYGTARTDIAGAFPGFSNTAAAGGHFIIDWSTLTPGTHTIAWLVTDDCNRADGVGSRFFNMVPGITMNAAPSAAAMATPSADSAEPITVARGYGELPQIVAPGAAGSRVVEVRQGDRIEVRVPRGYEAAYQLVSGGRRVALPTGSTWDSASGTFYWQPAPAFLGRYRIVFSNGTERISVRVIVTP